MVALKRRVLLRRLGTRRFVELLELSNICRSQRVVDAFLCSILISPRLEARSRSGYAQHRKFTVWAGRHSTCSHSEVVSLWLGVTSEKVWYLILMSWKEYVSLRLE